MNGAVRLENYSYAWPGAGHWTLRELSLEFPQGQCLCLSGASGAGKTTLALALKGLLPQGRQAGRLLLPEAPTAERAAVGLVLQNPETQLLTESLGAEVAFGLENLCIEPERMPERVVAALAAVGLDLPLDHAPGRLSMGQQYRLLIAAQLVLEPALLILDEPAGQLDAAGLKRLATVIDELKNRGLAVLLCEHRLGPLAAVVDRHWQLTSDGRLLPGPPPEPPALHGGAPPLADSEPVVEASGLTVAVADAAPAWQEAQLSLRRGERVQLCAPNGAGKTTLLRCLAGLITPSRGQLRVCGGSPSPERLRGRVGYLFQNPRRQLFETTVFAELAFTLRRLGLARAVLEVRVAEALEACGIAYLAERSPHRLSYGQQHLVALAAVLAPRPELLLLDDPLAGLDPEATGRVLAALQRTGEEHGTTVFWTSHHPAADRSWNHRTLGIDGGRLVQH